MDEDITLLGRVLYYHVNEEGMQELGMIDVIATDTDTANELFKANKLYVSKPQGQLIIYTVSPVIDTDTASSDAPKSTDRDDSSLSVDK
ncbi:hypothetical protein D3C85_1111390 [compost metagenome]